ncbi:MAG: aldo/keto reductase [Candidatus Thorarchaeota archaeon]
MTRKLGSSEIVVSALGLGCWAAGGSLWYLQDGQRYPLSYGTIRDDEIIRAIHRALDLGVNFYDTADAYGCGHSERILGRAIEDYRDQVILATKFGNVFDEKSRTWLGHPDPPLTREYIHQCCEASLKRLSTDYIDLYQFHWKEYDVKLVSELIPLLDELVEEGMIRYYGWSTPYLEQAREFVKGTRCIAIQYNYNIFERNPEMLAFCSEFNQASIIRGPYAMGLLTGKYTDGSKLPENDMRHAWWNFKDGRQAEQLKLLASIQEILTRDNRTLVQGALGWLWSIDPQTIPIPGFKSVEQVEETIGALEFGPLPNEQMEEIEQILEPFLSDMIVID